MIYKGTFRWLSDSIHGGWYLICTAEINCVEIIVTVGQDAWHEKDPPVWEKDRSTKIFLDDLRQKEAGWRAKIARWWRPEDEALLEVQTTGSDALDRGNTLPSVGVERT